MHPDIYHHSSAGRSSVIDSRESTHRKNRYNGFDRLDGAFIRTPKKKSRNVIKLRGGGGGGGNSIRNSDRINVMEIYERNN